MNTRPMLPVLLTETTAFAATACVPYDDWIVRLFEEAIALE